MTYMECPRKYYFQKCMSFNPKTERNDREWGTAMHEAVASFYKNNKLPFEDRKLKAVQAFIANYDPACDTPKKNLNNGLVIVGKYCDVYKHDKSQYLMEMVETENVISMPNSTTLYMRIDRILIENGFYTVVDTKTTGQAITDYYWRDFELSFQLSTYSYAVEKLTGHCDNIQIDAIRVHASPEFVRRSFQRTEEQVQEWLNTYKQVTGSIRASFCSNKDTEVSNFYQNTGSCSKFGGCPYLPVCKYGLSHPDVQIMFNREGIE
jgi:hypothetical protein